MIIDNNVLFREGLANLLIKDPELCVVGEAGSICEAIDLVREVNPDLILMDSELPDIEEYNGVRALHARLPAAQIVMLSTRDSDELFLSAIRNGAGGFLPKNNSLNKLLASIHALQRGEAVIPRSMVRYLLEEIRRLSAASGQEAVGALTPREIEVLRELGDGRSNRQIAENLDIAENTVKVHVHNILEKLNLRNRRQAARFAHHGGIRTEGNRSAVQEAA